MASWAATKYISDEAPTRRGDQNTYSRFAELKHLLAESLKELNETRKQDITNADNLLYTVHKAYDKNQPSANNTSSNPEGKRDGSKLVKVDSVHLNEGHKQDTMLLRKIVNDETACDVELLVKHVSQATEEELELNGVSSRYVRERYSAILDGFEKLHEDNLPVRIPAHRVVLEASSDHLAKLIKRSVMKSRRRASIAGEEPTYQELADVKRGRQAVVDSQTGDVRVLAHTSDVRPLVVVCVDSVEAARKVVRFLYGYEFEVSTAPPLLLCGVLAIARVWGVVALTRHCLTGSARRMTTPELVEFSAAVESIQIEGILEEAAALLASHCSELLRTGAVLKLTYQSLLSVLRSASVMRPEADLFFAVKLWLAKHNSIISSEERGELWKNLRFDAMSPAQLAAIRTPELDSHLLDAALARLQASEGEGALPVLPPSVPQNVLRVEGFMESMKMTTRKPLMRARRSRPWLPNGAFVVDLMGGRFPVLISKRSLGETELTVRREMIAARIAAERGGPRDLTWGVVNSGGSGGMKGRELNGELFEEARASESAAGGGDLWEVVRGEEDVVGDDDEWAHTGYLFGGNGDGGTAKGSTRGNNRGPMMTEWGAESEVAEDDDEYNPQMGITKRKTNGAMSQAQKMSAAQEKVRQKAIKDDPAAYLLHQMRTKPPSALPSRPFLQPRGFPAAPYTPLPLSHSQGGSFNPDAPGAGEMSWRTVPSGSDPNTRGSVKPPGYMGGRVDEWAWTVGDPRPVSLATWGFRVTVTCKGHFKIGVASGLSPSELRTSSDSAWYFDSSTFQFGSCDLGTDPFVWANEIYHPRSDGSLWGAPIEPDDFVSVTVMVTRATVDLEVSVPNKHMSARHVFVHDISGGKSGMTTRALTGRVFLTLRPFFGVRHEGDTMSMGAFM